MPSRVADTTVVSTWIACGSYKPVDEHAVHAVVVDQDVDQPDMCVLTLNNSEEQFSSKLALGDPVEVKVGGEQGTTIFKGEVVGLEPIYKTGGETRCLVRAFSRLHRLLRGRKSRTFAKKKDSDIASQIASENGLSPKCDATSVTHEHLYQHNQTDLEFLRLCAARNGFEVFVEDKELFFRKPRADKDSGIQLELNEPEADHMLETFTPRLSSAGIVQEVEVRAWNPEEKKEIVARKSAGGSALGGSTAAEKTKEPFGQKVSFTVDRPVATQEEADKLAQAKLDELSMGYITGEGVVMGKPDIKAGMVVTVKLEDARFDGKYFVVSASHRYRHSGAEGGPGGGGGYRTAIRVRRDAEGA